LNKDGHKAVSETNYQVIGLKILMNVFLCYAGIGSEICARIMEHETFFHLDAPVWRVTGVDAPMPYAKSLEAAALPQVNDVVNAVNKVLGVK
jgi:pyruvate/2-oxoglutarate/acetoin dehydrogenase E1 component